MLRKYSHHGLPYLIQMETFYNGLNIATKQMEDGSANWAILSKTCNEAYEILERINPIIVNVLMWGAIQGRRSDEYLKFRWIISYKI